MAKLSTAHVTNHLTALFKTLTAFLDLLPSALELIVHAISEALVMTLTLRLRATLRLRVWMPDNAGTALFEGDRMVVVLIAHLVLLEVNEVPALSKVCSQILDDGSAQRERDISPAHSRVELPVELVVLPVLHILEVHDSCVVVVLTREDDLVEVSWMGIT